MAGRWRSAVIVAALVAGLAVAFIDSHQAEANTLAAELQHCDVEADADACRAGLAARGPACFDAHHRAGGKYSEARFDAAAFRSCIRRP